MAKRKAPATEVDGHKIQQPRTLDAANEREVTRRNDAAVTNLSEAELDESARNRKGLKKGTDR